MQRKLNRLARAILLLVLLGLAAGLQAAYSPAARAHGDVIRSEPAANTVLEEAPERVTIWFTERLETQFGDIQVLDGQGQRVDRGDSAVDDQDRTVMSASLPPRRSDRQWQPPSQRSARAARSSARASQRAPSPPAPSRLRIRKEVRCCETTPHRGRAGVRGT